ncbi:carbohydrate binding domain-containing protein [Phytomonospora sp. NPDC050363]|uniref:carbohydrate binding domain-containing protein n=1 Tax=Phytomonospora sp. NPDC050363 TaxID=3155642 RepID=UPI0033DD6082
MKPISIYRPLRTAALAVLLLTAALVPASAAGAAPSAQARAYYVDCSGSGGDGSASAPFRTLAQANAVTLAPGDQLLLKRGVACAGGLAPKGSGTAAAPITIAAYGSGTTRPVVNGGGTVYAGVHLLNMQQVVVRGLEITNKGTTVAERNGLLVEIADIGVGRGYRVDDVYVHDVNGGDSKGSNGIQFRVSGTAIPTRFDGVVVENSEIRAVDREGLTTGSSWGCRAVYGCTGTENWLASTNVVYRNNVIHDIAGDGLVMRVADGARVEGNEVYDVALRSPGNNAGLWTINSDNTIVQYNEVYRVNRVAGTNDGMAFDSDFGNRGVVFQYNYSHDNEGGFMLFCGACGGASSSTGTVVRYNLSVNDGSRILYAVGEKAARIYNNTFYLPSASTTKIIEDGGGNTFTTWSNNIVYNLGSGGYTGGADHTWRDNTFYGSHPASEPADPGKSTADPLLVAPGGGPEGHRLQSASPAKGTGTVVAGNGGRDYFGGPVPAVCAPDRGAHQASAFSDGTCQAPNLVANGGFESGTTAGWTPWNSATVTTAAAHSGTYGLRAGPSPASVEQTVAVAPNTTYVLSGWGRVSATGTELVIGVKNHGGTEARMPAFTTTAYAPGTVTFTTGPSNTTARVYCYTRLGGGEGRCDDVSVRAV